MRSTRPAGAARLVAVAAAAIALPGTAWANGRFPTARFMTFGPGPGPAAAIGLQTTFGYVFSRDGGASWQLRCEEAIGFDPGSTWDPPLVLTAGRAIAGLPAGLASADADFCRFDPAPAVPDEPIVDLASDPDGRHLVAALGPLAGAQGVLVSDDGGLHWRRGWSREGFFILTVEIAPGRPQRIYASGLLPGAGGTSGVLFRSDDGGATFTETARGFGPGGYVYLAAVDPGDPDVVYLRADQTGGTVLLRSDDGAATFTELRRSRNRMTGFALAPDGQTVWTGSPGDLPADGIHESRDRGATWQPRSGGHTVLCLRQHDGILYMCTSPEQSAGVALTCSDDGGATFHPMLRFADLAGPESCPAGTPGRDRCAPSWPALRARLASDGGASPPGPPRCGPAAGAAADAGTPGATASRGAGCACTSAGGDRGAGGGWILLAIAALTRLRRAGRPARTRQRIDVS